MFGGHMSHIGNGAPGGIYCGVDGALETVGRYCSENDHASESAVISHSVAPRRAALRCAALPGNVTHVAFLCRARNIRTSSQTPAIKYLGTEIITDTVSYRWHERYVHVTNNWISNSLIYKNDMLVDCWP